MLNNYKSVLENDNYSNCPLSLIGDISLTIITHFPNEFPMSVAVELSKIST